MTVFVLKIIALVTMVIDHTGVVFGEAVAEPLLSAGVQDAMYIIGRVAFPLYAFMLVEGVRHTRDWRKYALRLFGLALLSQIPYAFTINGWVAFSEMPWWRRITDLNVLFTLTLGVLMLAFLNTRRLEKVFVSWWAAAVIGVFAVLFYISTIYDVAWALGAAAVLTAAACVVPKLRWTAGQAVRFVLFAFVLFWYLRKSFWLPGGWEMHFSYDYGFYAFVLFVALYWAKTPIRSAAVMAVWGIWANVGSWQCMAAVAVSAICVACYNGQKGINDYRLFYWAYPAHLFLLWGAIALFG